MTSWFKRFAATVAVVALFIVAPAAVHAEDVHYYVTGTFNLNVASVAIVNQYQTDSVSVGTSTITFRNNTSGVAADGGMHLINFADVNIYGQPFSFVDFGSFFVQSSSVSGDSFTGTTFTLEIFQVVPGSGSDTSLATVTGNLVGSAGNASGSSIALTFAPLTLSLPPAAPTVRYDIDTNASGKVIIGAGTSDVTVLNGTVTSVPLPGIALAGMALMGCVGGLRKARNRAEEPAVA